MLHFPEKFYKQILIRQKRHIARKKLINNKVLGIQLVTILLHFPEKFYKQILIRQKRHIARKKLINNKVLGIQLVTILPLSDKGCLEIRNFSSRLLEHGKDNPLLLNHLLTCWALRSFLYWSTGTLTLSPLTDLSESSDKCFWSFILFFHFVIRKVSDLWRDLPSIPEKVGNKSMSKK